MITSIKESLTLDLRQALKDGNKSISSIIRVVMAAIKNVEIARQKELDDTEIIGVIAKQIKQSNESIESFKKGGRQDLVEKEEAEIAYLNKFIPKQMSRQEIITAASKIIKETGAQSPRDKGKVMSKLMSQLKGKADGAVINTIVSELLNQ